MTDPVEILATLERWAEAVNAADEALDLLGQAVGTQPESPICTAVWDLMGLADQWAAQRIGTSEDWLEWYRIENDMGQRAHEAGWKDDMRPIRNLEDFAALLAEDVRRAAAEAAHG